MEPTNKTKETIWERIDSLAKVFLPPTLVSLLLLLFLIFLIALFSEGFAGWIAGLLGSEDGGYTFRFVGIAMVLAVMGIVANRRTIAVEDTANAQRDVAGAQTAANETVEQGQQHERLKNAIEHLAHQTSPIRLGGAYELFHLAEDAPALRENIFKILCTHIRHSSGSVEYQENYTKEPSTEIQSLLTLLFVDKHDVFQGLSPDLQGSWLNGASLIRARLGRADLRSAQLQGAFLSGARLQGAYLQWAHLQGADLQEADLKGADLYAAQVQAADLNKADLKGAGLRGAALQGARLQGAHLQAACLFGTELQEAFISGAHMQGIYSSDEQYTDFHSRVQKRTNEISDFSRVMFAGDLSEERWDYIKSKIVDFDLLQYLRQTLEQHFNQPGSSKLRDDTGAEVGKYNQKDANTWITAYEKADAGGS